MQRLLLVVTIIFFSISLSFSQAPGWQWAKDANSTDPESGWDVAYDAASTNVYVGGGFKGNLSSVYGSSFASSYGNQDGFIAKYDQSGTVLWAIKFGGINNDEVHGVSVDASGNVYATGYFTGTADFDPTAATYTLSSAGGTDGFLAKYSSAGALLWAVKFGGTGDDDSWKMYNDANGIYITGSYQSPPATFYSYSSVTTKTTAATDSQLNTYGAKYNSSGVVQWVISGGGSKDDIGFSVVADASNVYFIGRYDEDIYFRDASGTISTLLQDEQNNKPQVYIIAISQAGAISWKTNITSSTGGDMVIGWSIAQDATNLYVTGYFDGNISFKYPTPTLTQNLSGGGSLDLFLAKLSKTGTFLWNASVTGNGNGEQIGRALEVDANGNVILAGVYTNGLNYGAGNPSFTASGGHDIFVTAYSNAGTFLWSTTAGGNTRDYLNGMTVDNSGGIYVCGEEDGVMVIGTNTLTSGGGRNVFVAKLGCPTLTNNVISASQTICAGAAPATFTGTLPSGSVVYTWQSSSNSTTWTAAPGTFTNQNYTASSLTATTYYRRIVAGAGSCSLTTLASNTISVATTSAPSAAAAGSNQTLCATTATLNATAPAIGSGSWSVLSGTSTVSSATNPASPVTGLSVGTNSFVWTVSNGVCASTTATVSVVRNAQPTSNAGSNQTLCAVNATMAASTPGIGTGVWSLSSGSGTIAGASSPTSAITSLGTGTNIFIWTVSNGVCTPATSTVSIIRYAQPTSFAGSNQTVCASTATLSATNPTIGAGAWSILAGTSSLTSVSNSSSQVTALNAGANTYEWTVTNGVCTAATSTVSIIRDLAPSSNAGPSQTICAATATLAATTPTTGTGSWSLSVGAGILTSSASASSQLTSLGTGTNIFIWTVSNGVCTPATSTVSIIRYAQPTAFAGSNQTVCASTATLSATNPTIGTGAWSLVAGTSSLTAVSNPSSQVTSLNAGTNTYVWTVTNGVCTAATSTVSVVRDLPPTSNAGVSQTVCAATSTLAATTPTTGTGSWSLSLGAGILTNSASAGSQLSALGTGTNTFIWTVSNGACPSATSAVTVVRLIQPASQAGVNQTVCSTSATLAATNPTTGTGAWSVVSGTSSITSVSNPSSSVSSLNTGTNTFIWTVTNGICPTATSAITIVRDIQPASNAGSSQTICSSNATLAAISPTVGTGTWSLVSGSGNITTVGSVSSAVSSLGTGTNNFAWTVSNGVCAPSTSTVNIIRNLAPTANAGLSQTVCASTVFLAAVSPTVGSGTWSVITGTSSLSSATNPSTQVTALSTGTNQFLWTVINSSCPSATSAVTIIRDSQNISANAGVSQTVCAPIATLAAITPTLGTGAWSLGSGAGTLTSVTNPSSSVGALAAGANSFIWTVSNGACAPVSSTVQIIRLVQPTANAGSSQTICTSTVNLAAVSPTAGSGLWSVLVGTSAVSSANSNTTSVSGVNTGSNVYLWTVSNGICTAATSTVAIFRDIQPSSNAGSTQSICASTATLAAINPTTGAGSWSIASGAGSITSITNASTQVTSLATGVNSFVWTVINGVCPAASSTVNLVNFTSPSANAGVSQTICAATATLNAILPSVGTGSWSVSSGSSTVTSVSNPSSAVTGLGNGLNTFVWNVTNGPCPTATSAINILRDVQPFSNAGSDQSTCIQTATLGAVTPTVGVGTWSLLSGSGVIVSPSSPSTAILALGTGSNSFAWKVSNGSCPDAISTVAIIKGAGLIANAGVSQSVCSASATLSADPPAGGSGIWSVTTGTSAISTTTNALSEVTSLNYGLNTFLWTVSGNGCPVATSLVNVWRDIQPTAIAGPDQFLCSSTATLSAVSPTIGTGSWSIQSGTATAASFVNPLFVLNALGTGTNVFIWSVVNGVCLPATSSVMVVRDIVPVSQAGNDQTVCSQTAALAAINPPVGTGSWSLVSGGASISTSTNPLSQISSLATGTNVFVWTVSNGSCPSATSTMAIVRDEQPSAYAGADQTVCATNATLAASSPTLGTGAWSNGSGSGNLTSASNAVSAISGLGTGTNSFVWTVSNGVCPPATSTVLIIGEQVPGLSNAGSDFTICSSSCTLAAIPSAPGVASWQVFTGTSSLVSANNPGSTVTNLNSGLNQFIWTNTNGTCPPSMDTVSVYFTAPLPAASAGPDQTLCTSECTLVANNQGFGSWSVLSGNATLNGAANATVNINALTTGTNIFVWTVSKPFCLTTTDTVIVIKDAAPEISNAGPDQRICGPDFVLSASEPLTGKGEWKLLEGSANFSDASSSASAVTELSAGINKLAWIIANGSCPSSSDTLIIQSDAFPSKALAGKDLLVCQDDITLDATIPATGKGGWALISGTCSIVQPAINNTSISGLKEGKHFLKWTVTNGVCAENSDTLEITRTFTPLNPDAGSDQVIETSSAELIATIPQTGSGTWSVISGNCEIQDIHDKHSFISKLPFGNTILRWTIANESCPDVSDDIIIHVKDLNIPNAFSPNGDGINDKFVITSLDYYKEVKISVFNRWGTLLYHNAEYKNNWEGINSNNENLADDTYYYIIEIPELKNFTGFIVIKRDK